MVLAFVFWGVMGLNFGIDFKGGIAIQAKAKDGKAELDQLRTTVGALGVGAAFFRT